ncbi:MAG: DNA repair protein RadC [Bacteroidales bacterium]|nr:DNA repair protein RadC [Bacteroidales bacterium]
MDSTKKTLKEWSIDDKPREKLLSKGISSLSDAELIAILIGSGNKTETAVELARRILIDQKSNLNELGKQTVIDLTKYKGIGEAKAISIVAALELGKRRNYAEFIEKPQITEAIHVFNYMLPVFADLEHEEFWAIFLNNSNKIIKRIKISQGGITSTTVDVRLIMKSALDNIATSLIVCHNHPSGNMKPSEGDYLITQKISEAGKILNIKLLDHVIISSKEFYSFAENSLIN